MKAEAKPEVKPEPGTLPAEAAKQKPGQPNGPPEARSGSTTASAAKKQPAAKRRALAAPGKKQPSVKKARVEDPHQRTLASFLAAPGRRAAPESSASAEHAEPEHEPQQHPGSRPAEPGAGASADQEPQHHSLSSAVKDEEVLEEEDLLAGVQVEDQLKIERAIERAAAARRQKQQKRAEERVLTDPSEGGFVKQGPQALDSQPTPPAMVADLSVADILSNSQAGVEAEDAGTKQAASAGHERPIEEMGGDPATEAQRLGGGRQNPGQNEPEHPSATATVKQEDIQDGLLHVKLEEAAHGIAPVKQQDTQQDLPEVKMEGLLDAKQEGGGAGLQLRKLGTFSSARPSTKGVANALIEKRRIRQRKAGIEDPEATEEPNSGHRAPASAQQKGGKAEDGVSTSSMHLLSDMCVVLQKLNRTCRYPGLCASSHMHEVVCRLSPGRRASLHPIWSLPEHLLPWRAPQSG